MNDNDQLSDEMLERSREVAMVVAWEEAKGKLQTVVKLGAHFRARFSPRTAEYKDPRIEVSRKRRIAIEKFIKEFEDDGLNHV